MSATLNVPIDELADRLAQQRSVWVRGAAVRVGDEWTLRLLDVVSACPPQWRAVRWRYPSALFFAERKPGVTVASWIGRGRMRLGGDTVRLDDLSSTCSCERRESGWSGHGRTALDWPAQVWNIGRRQNLANPYEELITEGSPSFISYDVAATCLLGVPLTGWNISSSEFVVRFQDNRARIARPHVSSTAIEFDVEGRQLANGLVELAGDIPGPTIRLATNRSRRLRFPLEDGLPAGAWIVLHRGDEWLDRRFLAEPYRRRGSDDVEYEIDSLTELETLVAFGEGPTVEYKEQLPDESDQSKRKVMKTVGAFANGGGGRIVFGVDDEMVVVGLDPDEGGSRACDRLANLVQSWVFPLPDFTVQFRPAPAVDGRTVIVLTVAPGTRRPYGVGTYPTRAIYYVRRGANSYAVGPEELRALAIEV